VVAEGIDHRIKLISEGYEALRTDVAELKQGQARLESREDLLDLHVLAVESRVGGVDSHINGIEKTQKVMLTEVRGLATKVDRLTRARGRSALIPNP
jgi:hypothetical protein